MFRRRNDLYCTVLLFATAGLAAAGCHQPENWSFTGPRVYLIEGSPDEASDDLALIQRQLDNHRINARLYGPDDWLKIIVDIDADPDEEVILVGHGHGAFLATQVVRHYAQRHKMKLIDAVFAIGPYNKDWPKNAHERGEVKAHARPMPIPIGRNAIKVGNFTQMHPTGRHWGSDLVTTRGSNIAAQHPDVRHETIDNHPALLQRIIQSCRKAALSPYHYTPPAHHPDVQKKTEPKPSPSRTYKAT